MAFSRNFSLLAGALASVAVVAPAVAQDAKALFAQRYDEMHKAMFAKDRATLAKFMAPDYEMVDIQGESHPLSELTERLDQMPSDPAMMPKTTVLEATISGETATVRQQQDMHMKRPMEDGTTAELDITVITLDTWVLRGGNWLLQRSVWKDISVSKDGEVVFHQAA